MITHLAHIGLVCPDIEIGRSEYARLLGREESPIRAGAGGLTLCTFPLENTALELISGATDDMRRALENSVGSKPKLTTLAWNYLDKPPKAAVAVRETVWRIPDTKTAGIKTFFVQETLEKPEGTIKRIDHIVLNTPNLDRARHFYQNVLGLRLADEKTIEDYNATLLFFRVGGLTFEIVYRLNADQDPDGKDSLWGITWDVGDIAAQARRLDNLGIQHNGIKKGMKPGTLVLTVKSGTQNIPTLFIEHTLRKT